mgnify:CR=1 FL=1
MLNDRDYMRPGGGGFRRPGRPNVSVVVALIWANVAVFLLQGLGTNTLFLYLGLNGPDIRDLQLWRIGTYMFAHGGMFHILVNMWGIYLFGRPLEDRLGSHAFLRLYFTSGIIGGLTWLLFNWNGQQVVIGASGALFGVIVAAAMLFPNTEIMLLFPPIPMKLKTFVFVFGGLEFFLALEQGGGSIAHIAHLGGLVGGVVFMLRHSGQRRRHSGVQSGKGLMGSLQSTWQRLRDKFTSKYQQTRQDNSRAGWRVERGGEAGSADDSEHQTSQEEVDRILDKIGREGLKSLTRRERDVLEKARRRLRDKRDRH